MSTGAAILVVEDEPQIHRFLAPSLLAAGYAAPRALTAAAEGPRLAATASPALVLLDFGLPDMDGREAIPACAPYSRAHHQPFGPRPRGREGHGPGRPR